MDTMTFQKRLPVFFFFVVYFFTCYIGVMTLIFGPQDFYLWFNFFSGATLPDIYKSDLIKMLLLLHLPPLLMWAGFEIYLCIGKRRQHKYFMLNINDASERVSQIIVRTAFVVSLIIAIYSLAKSGSLNMLTSWLDYNAWIHARQNLFQKMGFFEFVNIYMLIPVLGGLFVLSYKRHSRRIMTTGVILIIIIINLLIFQKKGMVVSLFVFGTCMYLYYFGGASPRKKISLKKNLAIIGVVLFVIYLVYILLVLLPVVLETSKKYEPKIESEVNQEIQLNNQDKEKLEEPIKVFDESLIPVWESRKKSLFLYTMMAPLTRTSAPAMAYPIVFPAEKNFYNLDIGQDIIGFGKMPDDNLVVWNKLWPDVPNGAVAAPYQFVLYSQGGMYVAFIGSFLLGIFIAYAWSLVIYSKKVDKYTSCIGSLVMLFSIYLAIDSFRNSIFVSYGVLWPAAIVIFMHIVVLILDKIALHDKKIHNEGML